MRRDRRDGPRQPDDGADAGEVDRPLRHVERRRDVAPRRRRPRSGGAGPTAGGARSSARSRRRPSARPRRGRRRRRARSSRRRCRRPGRARAARRRSSLVAPVKESSASVSPATTSGATPRSPHGTRRAPRRRSPRRSGVPGGRGGDEAHPLRPELTALRRVLARTREGALHRLGRDDAGAVDVLAEPDDLHPPHDVGERAVVAAPRRRAGGSSWCRSRRRRPAAGA